MPPPSEFLLCPVCAKPDRVSLSPAWQKKVEAGWPIDIVGCGNPWHYGIEGFPHIDKPHILTGDCWCNPTVEVVEPRLLPEMEAARDMLQRTLGEVEAAKGAISDEMEER